MNRIVSLINSALLWQMVHSKSCFEMTSVFEVTTGQKIDPLIVFPLNSEQRITEYFSFLTDQQFESQCSEKFETKLSCFADQNFKVPALCPNLNSISVQNDGLLCELNLNSLKKEQDIYVRVELLYKEQYLKGLDYETVEVSLARQELTVSPQDPKCAQFLGSLQNSQVPIEFKSTDKMTSIFPPKSILETYCWKNQFQYSSINCQKVTKSEFINLRGFCESLYRLRDGQIQLYINNPSLLEVKDTGFYNFSLKLFLKEDPNQNKELKAQILLLNACSTDIPLLQIDSNELSYSAFTGFKFFDEIKVRNAANRCFQNIQTQLECYESQDYEKENACPQILSFDGNNRARLSIQSQNVRDAGQYFLKLSVDQVSGVPIWRESYRLSLSISNGCQNQALSHKSLENKHLVLGNAALLLKYEFFFTLPHCVDLQQNAIIYNPLVEINQKCFKTALRQKEIACPPFLTQRDSTDNDENSRFNLSRFILVRATQLDHIGAYYFRVEAKANNFEQELKDAFDYDLIVSDGCQLVDFGEYPVMPQTYQIGQPEINVQFFEKSDKLLCKNPIKSFIVQFKCYKKSQIGLISCNEDEIVRQSQTDGNFLIIKKSENEQLSGQYKFQIILSQEIFGQTQKRVKDFDLHILESCSKVAQIEYIGKEQLDYDLGSGNKLYSTEFKLSPIYCIENPIEVKLQGLDKFKDKSNSIELLNKQDLQIDISDEKLTGTHSLTLIAQVRVQNRVIEFRQPITIIIINSCESASPKIVQLQDSVSVIYNSSNTFRLFEIQASKKNCAQIFQKKAKIAIESCSLFDCSNQLQILPNQLVQINYNELKNMPAPHWLNLKIEIKISDKKTISQILKFKLKLDKGCLNNRFSLKLTEKKEQRYFYALNEPPLMIPFNKTESLAHCKNLRGDQKFVIRCNSEECPRQISVQETQTASYIIIEKSNSLGEGSYQIQLFVDQQKGGQQTKNQSNVLEIEFVVLKSCKNLDPFAKNSTNDYTFENKETNHIIGPLLDENVREACNYDFKIISQEGAKFIKLENRIQVKDLKSYSPNQVVVQIIKETDVKLQSTRKINVNIRPPKNMIQNKLNQTIEIKLYQGFSRLVSIDSQQIKQIIEPVIKCNSLNFHLISDNKLLIEDNDQLQKLRCTGSYLTILVNSRGDIVPVVTQIQTFDGTKMSQIKDSQLGVPTKDASKWIRDPLSNPQPILEHQSQFQRIEINNFQIITLVFSTKVWSRNEEKNFEIFQIDESEESRQLQVFNETIIENKVILQVQFYKQTKIAYKTDKVKVQLSQYGELLEQDTFRFAIHKKFNIIAPITPQLEDDFFGHYLIRVCFGSTIVFFGASYVLTHTFFYLKSPQNRQYTWIWLDYLQIMSFYGTFEAYFDNLPPNLQVAIQIIKPLTSLQFEIDGKQITLEIFIATVLTVWIGFLLAILFLRSILRCFRHANLRKTINFFSLILWQSGQRLTTIFYFPLSILAFKILSKKNEETASSGELIKALAILAFLFLDIVLRIEFLTRAPRQKAQRATQKQLVQYGHVWDAYRGKSYKPRIYPIGQSFLKLCLAASGQFFETRIALLTIFVLLTIHGLVLANLKPYYSSLLNRIQLYMLSTEIFFILVVIIWQIRPDNNSDDKNDFYQSYDIFGNCAIGLVFILPALILTLVHLKLWIEQIVTNFTTPPTTHHLVQSQESSNRLGDKESNSLQMQSNSQRKSLLVVRQDIDDDHHNIEQQQILEESSSFQRQKVDQQVEDNNYSDCRRTHNRTNSNTGFLIGGGNQSINSENYQAAGVNMTGESQIEGVGAGSNRTRLIDNYFQNSQRDIENSQVAENDNNQLQSEGVRDSQQSSGVRDYIDIRKSYTGLKGIKEKTQSILVGPPQFSPCVEEPDIVMTTLHENGLNDDSKVIGVVNEELNDVEPRVTPFEMGTNREDWNDDNDEADVAEFDLRHTSANLRKNFVNMTPDNQIQPPSSSLCVTKPASGLKSQAVFPGLLASTEKENEQKQSKFKSIDMLVNPKNQIGSSEANMPWLNSKALAQKDFYSRSRLKLLQQSSWDSSSPSTNNYQAKVHPIALQINQNVGDDLSQDHQFLPNPDKEKGENQMSQSALDSFQIEKTIENNHSQIQKGIKDDMMKQEDFDNNYGT